MFNIQNISKKKRITKQSFDLMNLIEKKFMPEKFEK